MQVSPKTWTKSTDGLWFSQMPGGFKVNSVNIFHSYLSIFYGFPFTFWITYESIGAIQLNFLRLLYSKANQNVTFNCINSVFWLDAKGQNYRRGIRLMGQNEQEWSPLKKHSKPKILLDQCAVSTFEHVTVNDK